FLPTMLDVVHRSIVEDFVRSGRIVGASRLISFFLLVEDLRVCRRSAEKENRGERGRSQPSYQSRRLWSPRDQPSPISHQTTSSPAYRCRSDRICKTQRGCL